MSREEQVTIDLFLDEHDVLYFSLCIMWTQIDKTAIESERTGLSLCWLYVKLNKTLIIW